MSELKECYPSYDDFFLAELLLDIAEKEGLEIARAELKVSFARAELRRLRANQSTISNTTR